MFKYFAGKVKTLTCCTRVRGKRTRLNRCVAVLQQGFGNLDGEYWLGLEHLYWLTKQAQYKLRVALEDWQGRQVFAEYDSFHLEPESDWYRLRLGQYHGNAGDSLSWHNNKAFTTLDRDKDGYTGLLSPWICLLAIYWYFDLFLLISLFLCCVTRQLRSFSKRRLVVPHVCTLQSKWCVVSGWTLSQPLPGWGLLGRVPWRVLLSQTSFHDDQTHIT